VASLANPAAAFITNLVATSGTLTGTTLEGFTYAVAMGAPVAAVNIATGATQRAITNGVDPVVFAGNVITAGSLIKGWTTTLTQSVAAGVSAGSPSNAGIIAENAATGIVILTAGSPDAVKTDTARIGVASAVAKAVPAQATTVAFQVAGHIMASADYATLAKSVSQAVMAVFEQECARR